MADARKPGDVVVVATPHVRLLAEGVHAGALGIVIPLGDDGRGVAFPRCDYVAWYPDWYGFDDWDGPVPDELLARAVQARIAYALRRTHG